MHTNACESIYSIYSFIIHAEKPLMQNRAILNLNIKLLLQLVKYTVKIKSILQIRH